jgi:hypothetical protein
MGEVIWHIAMSIDGCVAGPDDAMDWAFGRCRRPCGMGGSLRWRMGSPSVAWLLEQRLITRLRHTTDHREGDLPPES